MPDDRMPSEPKPSAQPGIVDRLLKTARDARLLAYDHLELAALEVQHAADNLVRILCGGVVISVLLVTAWIGLVAASAIWAMHEGLSLPAAMILAALSNIALATVLGLWIRSRMLGLMFTATIRQLRQSAGGLGWSDEEKISD